MFTVKSKASTQIVVTEILVSFILKTFKSVTVKLILLFGLFYEARRPVHIGCEF